MSIMSTALSAKQTEYSFGFFSKTQPAVISGENEADTENHFWSSDQINLLVVFGIWYLV